MSTLSPRHLTFLVAATLAALSVSARAATTTCVSTAAELQAAITAAAADHHDDTIRLLAGTYTLTAPLIAYLNEPHALDIEGGYSTCNSAQTNIPDNTIINGAGWDLKFVGQGGGITLRNLKLTAFHGELGNDAIAIDDEGFGDTLHIENVIVSNNSVSGVNDSIMRIGSRGALLFDDNVIRGNFNAFAAVKLTYYSHLPWTIANNTIADNAGAGLYIDDNPNMPIALYNNILWNNSATDLRLEGTNVAAMNNTWNVASADAYTYFVVLNNAVGPSADPKLTADYRLGAGSPAINKGVPLPMVFGPSALDAAGYARTTGSAPDKGAYESGVEDRSLRLVTSTQDSGAGTLRQAILAANSSGSPALIVFDLGNTCPQVITLTAPLPSPTVSLTIAGSSETGTVINSAPAGADGSIPYNGDPCVVLFNTAAPAVGSALTVTTNNVHVDVSNLRFMNFAPAIDIVGGSGNWVHGNAFAGPFFSSVVGNAGDVRIEGGYANVIGGTQTADTNLIAASTGNAGVAVSGSTLFNTISRNSIGGDPAATGSSYGNTNLGVLIADNNGPTFVLNNWIVANGGDGILVDTSSNTLVQSNTVGSVASAGLGNGGAGVHARNQSHDNWFGSTSPFVFAGGNRLQGNGGPGAYVDVDAGARNEIVANVAAYNGGLAVDLEGIGPTPNGGNETAGPNVLLHKATLNSAKVTGSNIAVAGSIAASVGGYRYFSMYASHRCGDAEVLLGGDSIPIFAIALAPFSISVPQPAFTPAYITVITSDESANTSESSNCKLFVPSDDLFVDGFDG